MSAAKLLREGKLSLNDRLERIVLVAVRDKLAYADDRRCARDVGFDFWEPLRSRMSEEKFEATLREAGVTRPYSASNLFLDFLFRTKEHGGKPSRESVLELKDSAGGSIASFNSIEVEKLGGNGCDKRGEPELGVTDRIPDGWNSAEPRGYLKFERRCFYLVRTHRNKANVKLSIVDGSFFETVPKEHLLYRLFMQVLRAHIESKRVEISKEELEIVERTLRHITDQRIIAGSKIIEGASVKPRLRVMAEVHSEGNPHSHHYEIPERSFNLILEKTREAERLESSLEGLDVETFTILHKRNGEHVVFSLQL